MPDPIVRLTVDVRVTDPDALLAYATRRYRACWDDPTWRPQSLGEAAYQALIASNETTAAPLDYGIELVRYWSDLLPHCDLSGRRAFPDQTEPFGVVEYGEGDTITVVYVGLASEERADAWGRRHNGSFPDGWDVVGVQHHDAFVDMFAPDRSLTDDEGA